MERRTRESHPRAHLRLERREEADRRRTKSGGGVNGGGAVELWGGCVKARLRFGAARGGGAGLK
jgi:hypothetical protein